MDAQNSLSSLLESSKKLTSHLSGFEIPAVERDLDLLESASRRLVSKAARSGVEDDPRVQTLLAGGGLNVDRLREDINNVSLAPLFEFNQPQRDPNIEYYLTHQQEQSIIGAIDDTRYSTIEDFDRYITDDIQHIWEEKQARLFDELGQHRIVDGGSFVGATPSLDQSFRNTIATTTTAVAGSAFARSRFDHASGKGLESQPRMLRYAKIVEDLNKCRLREEPFDIIPAFRKVVEESFDELRSKQIKENWNLLEMLVKSCPEGLDGPQTASLLIGGSRRFLEESFVDYIEKVIAQRPLEAALGGSPSIHNKIRSFLKLKFSSSKNNPDYLEVYNDDAIWAHMYYLLRTGNLKEMLKYARAIEDAVADSDPYFIVYLKKYVDSSDHTLLPSDRERLQSSFNAMKSSPSSIDPYKFAIYKILGRCDLTKKTVPHTVRTTEDYIWLQLMLVRADESADVPAASRYTLRDLQRLLLKFGPKHFDPHGNNPLLYFRVLLLSLQFEQAINHLVQSEVYQVDAMHFAVALAYYNYLRRISPEQTTHYADYVSVVDDVSYLDYAKLVIHYIRALPADAIEYAVHYLITINTGGTTAAQHQAQLCQSAIIRVLYESREYAYFLGDILKDGSRKRGFLEQYYGLLGFKSKDEFVFGTTKQLADKSHKDGRLPDSVLLYNLAGQYNSVLKVMIKQLGEVLYMHNNRGAMAGSLEGRGDRGGTLDTAVGNPEDVVHIAHAVLKHYESQDHIYSQIDKGNVTTCHLLLSLINFVQAYSDGKLELALSIIQNTGLVPFDCDIAEATRKSEQIRDMDPTITRNFADILLATMDIMSKLYAGLKESPYLDATRQANMDKLRRSVRSLMVFAGMIQFRMPPDTFARLNRIDAFMN